MSAVEAIAAALGLVCVALVVRRSMWNYAFGIASTALYIAVFHHARLYSDALLQIFFVVVNAYGWINWRGARRRLGDIAVETMTPAARAATLAACAAATLAWGWLMHRYTDASYPWPDAAIAITSIAAQILMAQRRLENWVLWIAVDVAAIPLFLAKGLWVTAALYALYLALAVSGLIEWRRVWRAVGVAT